MWYEANTIRLGSSIEQLARETYEDIMGFDGKGEGHRAPRADIAKLKGVRDLFEKAKYIAILISLNDSEGLDTTDLEAEKEWKSKYTMYELDKTIIEAYQNFLGDIEDPFKGWDEERAFNRTVDWVQSHVPTAKGPGEAKAAVGKALKKYEQSHWPMLYDGIERAMTDVWRRGPMESHKLWPRMVAWIKDEFQKELKGGNLLRLSQMFARPFPRITHMADVVTEGGQILDQLRRENKTPQNMDVNQMNFSEFENWLMSWKRDNRDSEAKGEVVYEWPDGYTIQKLTTPEQLQFEGDEMGHCVGGYSRSVDSGETIIYSLRDKKDTPHVTIEMNGASVYAPVHDKSIADTEPEEWSQLDLRTIRGGGHPVRKTTEPEDYEYLQQLQGENREDLLDQRFPNWLMEKQEIAPDTEGEFWERDGKPFDRTFEVVQIMGNSNQTPKKEYQDKVKEWLTSLKEEKGAKFIRSDDWMEPFDMEYDRETYLEEASQLVDWYDHYSNDPDHWKGVGDEYGLNHVKEFSANWDKIMEQTLVALVDDYDRSNWKTNDWSGMAQAFYHGWLMESNTYYQRRPADYELVKKSFIKMLDEADEKVMDWVVESHYYWREGAEDEIKSKYVEKGGSFEDEYEDTAADQDLWQEATDEIMAEQEDFMFGNCHKFLGYLYNLAEHAGIVPASELPDPRGKNGGLPDYDSLVELNEKAFDQAQQKVEIPGALG